MKPGELRIFNVWAGTHYGVALTGKACLLLEPLNEGHYKQWRVLLDGKKDVLDEHTLVRFTDEAR